MMRSNEFGFQPTLPARGATGVIGVPCASIVISTHAPRTGSDLKAAEDVRRFRDFNPRSPHGERRRRPRRCPPMPRNFNPRSPHGERRRRIPAPTRRRYFNPRSPHGERPVLSGREPLLDLFQPTLPARGATLSVAGKRAGIHISTHAPRTGSDCWRSSGHRRSRISTHAPRTGSDAQGVEQVNHLVISTHAPRTGSDSAKQQFCRPES